MQAARQRRAAYATDLRLPVLPADLAGVEAALGHYQESQLHLTQAIQEVRLALPELQRQRTREDEARDTVITQDGQLSTARIEAEEASTRFDVLREAVGAKVEDLRPSNPARQHSI